MQICLPAAHQRPQRSQVNPILSHTEAPTDAVIQPYLHAPTFQVGENQLTTSDLHDQQYAVIEALLGRSGHDPQRGLGRMTRPSLQPRYLPLQRPPRPT